MWWQSFDLACEIHGIPHMRVENWDEDLLRFNEVSIRGDRTLVLSSLAIRRQPARVKDQLRRMTAWGDGRI